MKEELVAAYQRYLAQPTDHHRDLFLVEVTRYAQGMYGHDRKLQPSTREDLAQEATIKVWRHLDGFDGRSSIATWVHRICANLRCDHFTRTKVEEQIPELFDLPATFRDAVAELPAWLVADPIAREVMDGTMKVADLRKKYQLSKSQYYRHLQALGRRMIAQNSGTGAEARV